MAKVIKVINLSTGEEQTYMDISPRMAVTCAFEHARGNDNTWTYDWRDTVVSRSGKTVSRGDWCAMMDEEGGNNHGKE